MLKGRQVLILEDENYFLKLLTRFLESKGAEVYGVGSIEEARNLWMDLAPDFALLDVNLPDGNSLDLLRDGIANATIGVIVMTSEGGIETAVEAMRLGAADYLSKPFEPEELTLVFKRIEQAANRRRLDSHREAQVASSASNLFFGKRLTEVEAMIGKILDADARLSTQLPAILIQGETGSGKSTIARWIHQRGPRANCPLVEINCSTLPETLAESELFGHEKGAFTDARATKIGLFEAAEGGTLFLDEISSLPLKIQAKLLTAIEDQTIRRVGGNRHIKINVRIVAAVIEPLSSLVEKGAFREDLFHRLDLLKLTIPPIRDYPKDLPALAEYLTGRLEKKYRHGKLKLSPQSVEAIQHYFWPGNVRELAHELERAIIFKEGDLIELILPQDGESKRNDSGALLNPYWKFEEGFNIETEIEKLSQALIDKALKQTNGNVSAASRLLGVNRDFIRYRLKN